MFIPIKYNVRYLGRRWKSTAVTAFTFGLVVATFVIVMSLSEGIKIALTTTADPLNVIIMRDGAQAEGQSQIGIEQYQIVRNAPGIALDDIGEPFAAPELLVPVNKPRMDGKAANIQIRGIHRDSYALRPAVRIVEGRKFRSGLREIIVARAVSNRFKGFRIGDTPKLGGGHFTVVGIFEAQRTAYDSEIWGDCKEMMQEFDREQYSSVAVRARDRGGVAMIKAAMTGDKRLKLMAKDEAQYYSEQTKTAGPVKAFAVFLAFTMAIGACFAGMNTMYANVASRVREIGTLRILGFRPVAVMSSFLIESVFLSLIGGVLGCIMALPMNGLATGTTNFDTFSEVVFYFSITPSLMLKGMIFAASMGFIGGLFPAWTASRQSVLSALRDL